MPRSEFGWSLCYLSEVSLVVAWLLKCNIWSLDFYELWIFYKKFKIYNISCSTHNFYISRMPISYSTALTCNISSIHHYFIFLWLQRSIGQPKVWFLHISKNHNKKNGSPKKKIGSQRSHNWSVLSLHFFRRDGVLYSESGLIYSQILGRPPT